MPHSETLNPNSILVGLPDFLDSLRACDYSLGIDEYLRAQDLIVTLVSNGRFPDQADRLCALLRPLLSSRESEQREFDEHFYAWLREISPVRTESFSSDVSSGEIKRRTTWLNWINLTVILAGGIYLSTMLVSILVKEDFIIPIGMVIAVTMLVWFVRTAWWRHQARLILAKCPIDQEVKFATLPINNVSKVFLEPKVIQSLASQLSYRSNAFSCQLDVEKTIEYSLKTGYSLIPFRKSRKVSPEYIALIDRRGSRDIQAQLYEDFLDSLIANGVLISIYFFIGDPGCAVLVA